MTLEKYYKLIRDPQVLKSVDSDKLVDFMLDYNPTLKDVKLYMQALTLYVQTTRLKFDVERILYAIERCKKVSDSDEEEEIINDILEYFIRLFGLFLDGVAVYPALVYKSIFDYIEKYSDGSDDSDEDPV